LRSRRFVRPAHLGFRSGLCDARGAACARAGWLVRIGQPQDDAFAKPVGQARMSALVEDNVQHLVKQRRFEHSPRSQWRGRLHPHG
jgi:hypothetical protein